MRSLRCPDRKQSEKESKQQRIGKAPSEMEGDTEASLPGGRHRLSSLQRDRNDGRFAKDGGNQTRKLEGREGGAEDRSSSKGGLQGTEWAAPEGRDEEAAGEAGGKPWGRGWPLALPLPALGPSLS